MTMNILLTGASGFIGKHVHTQLLLKQFNVLPLTRDKTSNNNPNLKGCLSDLESVQQAIIDFEPDVVIHLAWQDIPDFSEKTSRLNLDLSINFFDFVLEHTHCKKIIVSGSCWEYGRKKGACIESDKENIESYFTWAKNSLYQYLSIKCIKNNVRINWFRLFYVYGPGQKKTSLIPTLVHSIAVSNIPCIKTPMNKNDFVYVVDVAYAIAIATEKNYPSGIYNLGSGKSTSVYEICKIVENQLSVSSKICQKMKQNGEQTEAVNFWSDMSKTQKIMRISCNTTLEDGIKSYIFSLKKM